MASTQSTATSSPGHTTINELQKSITRNTNLPWYRQSYGSRLTPASKQLFLEYSNVPEANLEQHIKQMRDDAWNAFPFPCIGEFWFLVLGLSEHPQYQRILDRLLQRTSQDSPGIVDIGTAIGQDLRKLVFDGVSPAQVLGVDILPQFEAIGCRMFNDEDRFGGRFAQADITKEIAEESLLHKFRGHVPIVASSMVLHSFDQHGQLLACQTMLKLACNPGGWLVGCLTGTSEAREIFLKPPFVPEGVKRSIYLNDKSSLHKVFADAGSQLGLNLNIVVEIDQGKSQASEVNCSGGVDIFQNAEQKLLWYFVEII